MKILNYKKLTTYITLGIFLISMVIPTPFVSAQNVLNLPAPGTMIGISPNYTPAIVEGITIYPDNPLQFDFIIDVGDDNLQGDALRKEAEKLIRLC